MYMNGLQKQVKMCKTFGYAGDFKLVTTQPTDIQLDLGAVEC